MASTKDPGAALRVGRTKDSEWRLKPKDDEDVADFVLDVTSDPDFVIVSAEPPAGESRAIRVCARYLHHEDCTRVLIFEEALDAGDSA